MTSTIRSRRAPLAASAAVIASGVLTAAGGWAGPSSAATMPAPAPACSLKITNGGSQGALGTSLTDIVFTNTSRHACGISGYPGASLRTASGKQIGAPADRNGNRPVMVILRPGGKAHATVGVSHAANYPRKTCRPVPAAWLRITPPHSTVATWLRDRTTGCANSAVKQLWVTNVTRGADL